LSARRTKGRLIVGAANLGSQPGWRGRIGRVVAYLTLVCAALGVMLVISGVVWLSL
jgi:hypothetical protein